MQITNDTPARAVERPLVLVIGATGAQGGGVARHLLRRGRFAVRALTRNADSPAARALREAGAEVVRGDLADVASLRAAAAGCDAAFGVTNFWEHFDGEYQHGINLVDAVRDAGVRHLVLSTLPSVRELTGGELKVPHFDLKAGIEAHARRQSLPATYLHVAFYFDNFLTFFPPRRRDDGTYHFGFPQGDTPLAAVASEDVGGVAATILERPEEFIGRTVYVAGDEIPPADYAAVLTRVTGRPVVYQHVPRETFAALGFPGAEDLADMFEFYRTRVPSRAADIARSRELYPELRSFERWAIGNRERLVSTLGA